MMAPDMNPQALIAAIVQETTVLIAQISTTAGIRAPLARVADQVFLSLAREIESQGVGRKVVADMFGMAIRTYQKKVQRLTETQSMTDRTVWEALLAFLHANGPTPRGRLLERFAAEPEVTSILNDLVISGMVYASGRGESAIYGVTSEADRRALRDAADPDALAMQLWAHVFDNPGTTRAQLREVGRDATRVNQAVDRLLAEGRLQIGDGATADDAAPLHAARLVVALGEERGWEVALMQHYRAVTHALGAKVRQGVVRSDHGDRIGGATYTFGVHDDHPFAGEVYALLGSVRERVQDLWGRVSEFNLEHPEHEGKRARVTFYFGQNVVERDDDTGERQDQP
jgi:hypothetical protein